MICRTLLLCITAIAVLVISHTHQVSAFTNHPSRPTHQLVLKGASTPSSRRNTSLYAAVKKAAKKKDSDVVNFKKADFVSAVAEKTGMTKAESEMALAAVLNVIATVSLLLHCICILNVVLP